MSLHIKKYQAHVAASRLEIEAAEKGLNRRHSSGHLYKRYGVRRRFLVLWETFERPSHVRTSV